MALTLRQKQSLFVELVTMLLKRMTTQGYEMTFGEAYRSPEEAERLFKLGKGIKNSNHIIKLAIDINLFRDGKFLNSTEAHKQFGQYWKELHPSCRWGGDFPKPDGNHYSLEHNGKA